MPTDRVEKLDVSVGNGVRVKHVRVASGRIQVRNREAGTRTAGREEEVLYAEEERTTTTVRERVEIALSSTVLHS